MSAAHRLKLNAEAAKHDSPQRGALTFRGVVVTCLVLACLLGGATLYRLSMKYQALFALTGDARRFTLPDGSLVHVNAGSVIYLERHSPSRKVTLSRGEAFFDVEHDLTRPFTVDVPDAIVQAVGTEFDVNLVSSKVIVTVKSGRVRVEKTCGSDSHSALMLGAGQQAVVLRDQCAVAHRPLSPEELDRLLAWSHKAFIFNNTTLRNAVEQMNRYNRRHLLIWDPAIDQVPYSGSVDSADMDVFVNTLGHLGIKAIHQVRANGSPGDIALVGPGCSAGGCALHQ